MSQDADQPDNTEQPEIPDLPQSDAPDLSEGQTNDDSATQGQDATPSFLGKKAFSDTDVLGEKVDALTELVRQLSQDLTEAKLQFDASGFDEFNRRLTEAEAKAQEAHDLAAQADQAQDTNTPNSLDVILGSVTNDLMTQVMPDQNAMLMPIGAPITGDFEEMPSSDFAFVRATYIDGGGNRADAYYKIAGTGGNLTFMKIKTASASVTVGSKKYQVAVANTWDGTTTGSTDIAVLMCIPAIVGMTFHAIMVDHTAVNFTIGMTTAEVVWKEVVGGWVGTTASDFDIIGDTVEGSETADTALYASSSSDVPLRKRGASRVVYNESGDKTIYEYIRGDDFNSRGLHHGTSSEFRATVDAATSCPTPPSASPAFGF